MTIKAEIERLTKIVRYGQKKESDAAAVQIDKLKKKLKEQQ